MIYLFIFFWLVLGLIGEILGQCAENIFTEKKFNKGNGFYIRIFLGLITFIVGFGAIVIAGLYNIVFEGEE